MKLFSYKVTKRHAYGQSRSRLLKSLRTTAVLGELQDEGGIGIVDVVDILENDAHDGPVGEPHFIHTPVRTPLRYQITAGMRVVFAVGAAIYDFGDVLGDEMAFIYFDGDCIVPAMYISYP